MTIHVTPCGVPTGVGTSMGPIAARAANIADLEALARRSAMALLMAAVAERADDGIREDAAAVRIGVEVVAELLGRTHRGELVDLTNAIATVRRDLRALHPFVPPEGALRQALADAEGAILPYLDEAGKLTGVIAG